MSSQTYQRILLKYSGEAVAGDEDQGIDPKVLHFMSKEIKSIVDKGVCVGLVIGGGNLFRGEKLNQDGMDRVAGDHMGMLATVMNGIALRDALERDGIKTRVMSAIPMPGIVEYFDRRIATQLLEAGFVVIFTAGTGNPFFTTDTAAVLRGVEINADVIIKGTKVDGIYSSDPMKNSDAIKYDELTFDDVIHKNLKIMDMTAFTLCKENNIPIVVLDINDKNSLYNLMKFNNVGTLVS